MSQTPDQRDFAAGDIFVSPKTRGTYRVVRLGGGGILGEAATEQEAMLLACAERRDHNVWIVNRADGTFIAAHCPNHPQ